MTQYVSACYHFYFSKESTFFLKWRRLLRRFFFLRKRRYERSKKLSQSLIKLLRNKSLIYTIKPTSSSAYKIQSNNDVNLDHKASIYANENEREEKFIHKKKIIEKYRKLYSKVVLCQSNAHTTFFYSPYG